MTVSTIRKNFNQCHSNYELDITADKDFLDGLFEETAFVESAVNSDCGNITVKEIKNLCEKIVDIDFLMTKALHNWLINLTENDLIYAEYYENYIVLCYVNNADYDIYPGDIYHYEYDASLIYCPLKNDVYSTKTVNKKSAYRDYMYDIIEYNYIYTI